MPAAMAGSASDDYTGDPAQYLRIGRVMSVDRASARCTVAIGDPDADEILTAEIEWGVTRAGETIIWSPPSINEQMLVFCPEGDIAQAVPMGAIYSQFFPAPGNASREFIRWPDGAEFGYDPESQSADLTLPEGGTLRIIATGGVTIDGDVSVTGTITASEDVFAAAISLKNHKHGGVQAGGAQTGVPQ